MEKNPQHTDTTMQKKKRRQKKETYTAKKKTDNISFLNQRYDKE